MRVILVIMITASYGQAAGDNISNQSEIAGESVSNAGSATPDSSDTVKDADIADAGDVIPDSSDIVKSDVSLADMSGTNDTIQKPSVVPPPMAVGRFCGIGLGLSLGAIPLFEMWAAVLPDSMPRLGLDAGFGRNPVTGDTAQLKCEILEAPEVFNFFLPVSVSFHSISENRAVALALSFFYNAKQFQSTLYPSLENDRRIKIYETLRFYSVSIEAAYGVAIPPAFFSIQGSRQTFLTFTLGASPLQYFSRGGGVNIYAPEDDVRMRAAADSAKSRTAANLSANGASITWRAGLSSVKNLQSGNGLEAGLYYGGAYSGWFYKEGGRVMKSAIHTENEEKDKPLAFTSNRIELKMTLLRSIKKQDAE